VQIIPRLARHCPEKKTSSNIQLPDVFRRGEKIRFSHFCSQHEPKHEDNKVEQITYFHKIIRYPDVAGFLNFLRADSFSFVGLVKLT